MARTVNQIIDNQEITDIEFKKIMVNGSLEHINNTTARNTGAPQILSEAKIGDCQMTSSEKQKFEEDWARMWSVESISVDDANMTL